MNNFLALALADRNDPVTQAGQHLFNKDKQTRFRRAKVTVKDVTVESMDNNWHTSQPRGYPSDKTSFGRVGMHNIRLFAAK